MKITINTLSAVIQNLPETFPSGSQTIDLPEGSRVKHIFDYFQLPLEKGYSVIINKKVARPDDMLSEGMHVTLIQSMHGG